MVLPARLPPLRVNIAATTESKSVRCFGCQMNFNFICAFMADPDETYVVVRILGRDRVAERWETMRDLEGW